MINNFNVSRSLSAPNDNLDLKLLLVGVNYVASSLDTCIFRPGWLSDQDTILHMLVGCEPKNEEQENQH